MPKATAASPGHHPFQGDVLLGPRQGESSLAREAQRPHARTDRRADVRERAHDAERAAESDPACTDVLDVRSAERRGIHVADERGGGSDGVRHVLSEPVDERDEDHITEQRTREHDRGDARADQIADPKRSGVGSNPIAALWSCAKERNTVSRNRPKPLIRNLPTAPTAIPKNTGLALTPPASPAMSTFAQATPSGKGRFLCSVTVMYWRNGIIAKMPSTPPNAP